MWYEVSAERDPWFDVVLRPDVQRSLAHYEHECAEIDAHATDTAYEHEPDGATWDAAAAVRKVHHAINGLRLALQVGAPQEQLDAVGPALQAADALHTAAVAVLRDHDTVVACPRLTGLPMGRLLQLEGRRTTTDTRALQMVARVLSSMPALAAAFDDGTVSWSQARLICGSARTLDDQARHRVDGAIGTVLRQAADTDPDWLVRCVDDLVAVEQQRLAEQREQQAITRSFLSIQPSLDGSGGKAYLEGDAGAIAIITQTAEAFADPPARDDTADSATATAPHLRPRTRAGQLLEGLVRGCTLALALTRNDLDDDDLANDDLANDDGDGDGPTSTDAGADRSDLALAKLVGRSRPRLLTAVDARLLAGDDTTAARLLWGLAGGSTRITPLQARTWACDSTFTAILYHGARPVAVGDATDAIPPKLRLAVLARDGGCRFPGCTAPIQWCDVHHLVPRDRDGPTTEDNLAAHCRRDHLGVHGFGWKLTMHADRSITYQRGRRTWTTWPRGTPDP